MQKLLFLFFYKLYVFIYNVTIIKYIIEQFVYLTML